MATSKRISVSIETLDQLTAKTDKLAALLSLTYGTAGESFRNMADGVQDSVLWACAELADDCYALAVDVASAE